MRAELSEEGMLLINADSGAEIYALRAWYRSWQAQNGEAGLCVQIHPMDSIHAEIVEPNSTGEG